MKKYLSMMLYHQNTYDRMIEKQHEVTFVTLVFWLHL